MSVPIEVSQIQRIAIRDHNNVARRVVKEFKFDSEAYTANPYSSSTDSNALRALRKSTGKVFAGTANDTSTDTYSGFTMPLPAYFVHSHHTDKSIRIRAIWMYHNGLETEAFVHSDLATANGNVGDFTCKANTIYSDGQYFQAPPSYEYITFAFTTLDGTVYTYTADDITNGTYRWCVELTLEY